MSQKAERTPEEQQQLNDALKEALLKRFINFDHVLRLIEEGADVNQQDIDGNSALMYAAESGRRDVVESLLAVGAPVDLEDRNMRNALNVFSEKIQGEELLVIRDTQDPSRFVTIAPKGTVNPGYGTVYKLDLKKDFNEAVMMLGGCQRHWLDIEGIKERYPENRGNRPDQLAKIAGMLASVAQVTGQDVGDLINSLGQTPESAKAYPFDVRVLPQPASQPA